MVPTLASLSFARKTRRRSHGKKAQQRSLIFFFCLFFSQRSRDHRLFSRSWSGNSRPGWSQPWDVALSGLETDWRRWAYPRGQGGGGQGESSASSWKTTEGCDASPPSCFKQISCFQGLSLAARNPKRRRAEEPRPHAGWSPATKRDLGTSGVVAAGRIS